MSKCFGHKTVFLDTHRHFRPAIEISRIGPIFCGGLELKKSNLKNKKCGDTQLINDNYKLFYFPKIIYGPQREGARAIECTIHNLDAFWIVLSVTLVFSHMEYNNTIDTSTVFFLNYIICIYTYFIKQEKYMYENYIHIYIYI